MLRCTIEILPGGDANRARIVGLVEICRLPPLISDVADYAVVLTKTPPFAGALKQAWRRGRLRSTPDLVVVDVDESEDDELIVARVAGHHRTRRGSYDLLYRALRACGLESRLPREERG